MRRPDSTTGWGSWRRGHFRAVDSWDLGGVEIFDLESNPILARPSGFDLVHIYIPRHTLEIYAEAHGQRVPESFQCKAGVRDDVLLRWTLMLLPHFNGNSPLPESVIEDSIMILCAHLMKNYQSSSGPARLVPGGLTIWQRNRAERLLREKVTAGITLGELAAECNLSTNHFARAFKKSFGVPVHRYLLLKRFEFAKSLLAHSQKSLSSVALEAGFSDQAAFSRSFRAWTGTSPGDWRRRHQPKLAIRYSEPLSDSLPVFGQQYSNPELIA